MNDFLLELDYNGKQLVFPGRWAQTGFTHKIFIDVNGIELMLEPDEERNYRAVINPEHINAIDHNLVQRIVQQIELAIK